MAEDIIIRYVADTADLEKRLKAVEKQLGNVGDEAEETGKKTKDAIDKTAQSSNNLTMSMDKLAVAVAGAFAVQRIIEFSRQMSDLAVQVETTGKRMSVVFGASASEVEKAARQMGAAVGLSVDQFNLMATKVGDVLVPLGLARKDAAKMSTEAVKLAGALSEFSAGTVTMEQAVHAMVSAFTGEREALKTLGVVISEADVTQRLAEKGQKSLEGQALKTAKAFATFELIVERSADAQTFFAENGDSLARQTARTRAQIQTLKEDLAKALTPTIMAATKAMADFVGGLGVTDLIKFARIVATVVSGLVAYKVAVVTATTVTAAFGKTINATPIGLLVGGVAALATALSTQNSELEQAARRQESYNKGLDIGARRAQKSIDKSWERVEALRAEHEQLLINAKAEGATEAELAIMRGKNRQETMKLITKETNASRRRINDLMKAEEELMLSSRLKFEQEEAYRNAKNKGEKNDAAVAKSFETKRHNRVMKNLAAEFGLQGNNLTTKKLMGMIDEERNKLADHHNGLIEEKVRMHHEIINEGKEEVRLQKETLGAAQKRLKNLKDELALAEDLEEERNISEQIRQEEEFIKQRRAELGLTNDLIKAEENRRKELAKTSEEQWKAFEKSQQGYLKERKFLRDRHEEGMQMVKEFRQQVISLVPTQDIAESFKTFEENWVASLGNIYEASDETTKALLEDALEYSEGFQRMMIQLELDWANMSDAQKEQTKFAIGEIGNAFRMLSDEMVELAILELIVTKALIIGEAIKLAVKSSLKPWEVVLNYALILSTILSAWKGVESLMAQAQEQQTSNRQGFARGVVALRGEGSGTGDMIPAMLSAGESVITANRTRQYYDELSAIQSGTLDKLIQQKYIASMMNQQPVIHVDGGFTDRNLINQMRDQEIRDKKRHEQLIGVLNKRHVARKAWY